MRTRGLVGKERAESHLKNTIKRGSCLIHKGKANPHGYATTTLNGKTVRLHRLIYEHLVGPIGNLCVCHKCDVRNCINPKHLFLGTNEDNIRDRDKKGRAAVGARSGQSKLTATQVEWIKKNYVKGCKKFGRRPLARKFNMHHSTVWALLRGNTWKHV